MAAVNEVARQQVTEAGFEHLRAAPKVLAGLDTPMPYSAPLEDQCLPQVEDIVREVRAMAGC